MVCPTSGKANIQVFSFQEIQEWWVYVGLLKGLFMVNFPQLNALKTIIFARLSPSNYPISHVLFLMHFHVNKIMCSGCDWIYRTKGHSWAKLPTNSDLNQHKRPSQINFCLSFGWVTAGTSSVIAPLVTIGHVLLPIPFMTLTPRLIAEIIQWSQRNVSQIWVFLWEQDLQWKIKPKARWWHSLAPSLDVISL